MAPIPEWIHAVLHHQQVIASDASFAEKAIILLVVGHILVLYTVLCWLGASTITADTRDHRNSECLENQYELEPRSWSTNVKKHGPSSSDLHI
ncbi:uncharacterized protein N7496_001796 [Penicillium cataractarum]|uniref:Uncharacterized protein n=1 Tax=Penicillium cataractarum TaxID=2100454 RepID=A0A9W9VWQ0_9EURO|nr:uncharacterized protein N7496_001796 [Penicillium cataractarum]KAJ5390728.1 hypothetical protein N7496_001796 [Penicillium cataractarum]